MVETSRFADNSKIIHQHLQEELQNQTEMEPKENKSLCSEDSRLCEMAFWVKYSLFIINFFVWVGGIILVCIGIWARMEKQGLGNLDNLATDPAIFLLAIGGIMVITSIFGCVGSLRENICMLKIFCAVIAIVFTLEIASGIIAYLFLDEVKDHLLHLTERSIRNYQDDADLHDLINYVQRHYSCCGATSYDDWEVNAYFNCSSPAQSMCGVPPSCCRNYLPMPNIQCGYGIRLKNDVLAGHVVYTRGCIDELMTTFKQNLLIIGLIAFGVGFIEIFGIILAHSLIRNIMENRASFERQQLSQATYIRSSACDNYDFDDGVHC
ncbi:unnamed protein product [Owenia fusiformis]|uniref:Tetraspanin-33 n=1 Tax=Owenia fusiformis TaxID=6347 RepID=A0A8J1TCF1_OWEFU|nr:unnamed protein product [Owenia fusiformis]